MKRKLLAVLLAGTMLSGLLAGCGQEEKPESVAGSEVVETVSTQVTETQQEEVVEELTYPLADAEDLTWWVRDNFILQSEFTSADQSPFHTGLSEKTGVNIEWSFPAVGADVTTAYNLIWQEEELPNIIWSNSIKVSEGTTLLEDGMIYDLTEYLPEYAPDFWEFVNRPEYEDAKKLMTTLDGKFFGIPMISESDWGNSWMGPIIRTDWLKECGLDAPVTYEDWEKVMVAFKDKYDCAFMPPITQFRMVGLASGAGAYGSLNPRYYVDDNGTVKFANVQEEYKSYLTTLNKWYEMGLIDTDFTTANVSGVRAKALNNEVGITFGPTSLLTNLNKDAEAEKTGAVWEAIEYPRTAAGEPTSYVLGARTAFSEAGYAVITTSCSEEQLITALKLLNYGFTEEGINYWNYGTEGVSYTVDASGNVQWTETMTGDAAGLNEALKKHCGLAGGGPSVQLDYYKRVKNTEVAVEALDKWAANTDSPVHTVPAILLTTDENSTYTDKNAAITTYVQASGLKFITGEESLDNWDTYLAELDKLGLQECIKLNQASYDRQLNK